MVSKDTHAVPSQPSNVEEALLYLIVPLYVSSHIVVSSPILMLPVVEIDEYSSNFVHGAVPSSPSKPSASDGPVRSAVVKVVPLE